MVAERGPLVKAQSSHTHALCSHAPDKNQKHTGWYLKNGLISVTYSKNPSAMGNRKDTVKT